MVTREEEKEAFELLKRTYPTHYTAIDLHYESWYKEPYYSAYVSSDGAVVGASTAGSDKEFSTPMEAVKEVMRLVTEKNKKE